MILTFPDFTRHFFSSLSESVDTFSRCHSDYVDTSEKAVLILLTLGSCWTRRAWTGCSAQQRYGIIFILGLFFRINFVFPHFFLFSLLQMHYGGYLVADAHVGGVGGCRSGCSALSPCMHAQRSWSTSGGRHFPPLFFRWRSQRRRCLWDYSPHTWR